MPNYNLKLKRIIILIKVIPIIFNYGKMVYNAIKEVYNYETMKEIEELKENKELKENDN